MNKRLLLEIIAGIVVVLIAIAGYYYWQKYYRKVAPIETVKPPQTFGEQISKQAVTNPAEKIPQTNPYKAKTNPFEEVKTNPFQGGYKNPFGQ